MDKNPDDNSKTAGSAYTIPSDGPPRQQRSRFSLWEELFEECRHHPGEWRLTKNVMRKTSAAQLASDIRNAYKRNFTKSRLKGLRRDEVWDAAWGEIDGEYRLWIMYVGVRAEATDIADAA